MILQRTLGELQVCSLSLSLSSIYLYIFTYRYLPSLIWVVIYDQALMMPMLYDLDRSHLLLQQGQDALFVNHLWKHMYVNTCKNQYTSTHLSPRIYMSEKSVPDIHSGTEVTWISTEPICSSSRYLSLSLSLSLKIKHKLLIIFHIVI